MTRRKARLILLRLRRAFAGPRDFARLVAALVFVAGVLGSWYLAERALEFEREREQVAFDANIDQVRNTIAARFSQYIAIAQAGRALFAVSPSVEAGDWHEFSVVWRAERDMLPGLGMIAYARLHEDGAVPGIDIEPPGDRSIYCPIVYAAPPPVFPPKPGFDLCTRPVSVVTMMAARDRGEVMLSGRVLVHDQETGDMHDGVVIYGPAYDPGGSFTGWIVIPLIIENVLEGVLPDDAVIHLQLYDGVVDEHRLMHATGEPPESDARTRTVSLELAGRTWSMRFSQPRAGIDSSYLVLGAGAVISLLLAMLLWRWGTLHARAQDIATEMTTALRRSEEKYRTIIESLEDAYFETNLAGELTYFNGALARVLGYGMRELEGMSYREYMDTHNERKVFDAFNRVYRTGEPERGLQWEVIRKDRGKRYMEASISLVHGADGEPAGFRGIARDITERMRADERIHYLAHYDVLTGLPNRSLFEDRLNQILKRRWRGDTRAALLFIDLDRFKLINDTMGHHTGDMLLQVVGQRISDNVRDGDTVCRPGGDEFLVLLSEIGKPEDAALVAQNIITAVSRPYSIESWEFSITPSIGIAVIPDDGTDIDPLIRNADVAMYHAKESGRNNFQFFTADLNEGTSERLAIEHGIRRALDRDEFKLYYQPMVDVRTGRIIGAEALLRWDRQGMGLIDAGEFIGVAEQSGLILAVGEWVLKEACRQAQHWRQRQGARFPVAINLSALQFRQHGIPSTIASVLRQTGLDPSCLELELTETVLMQDARTTIETVRRLRDLGVHFSIDDFGTGYSSLSYLKRFPIDRLKIDRSFIRDLASDPEDAAIVSAVISMAGSLNMTVIAEGVEDRAQLEFLRERGCYLMQGFYFSAAVPADEFERLLVRGGFEA